MAIKLPSVGKIRALRVQTSFPPETRRRLAEDDSRWSVKVILRIVTTVFAFVGMILFAVAVSKTNANFINLAGDGDWTDGLALAPIVLSLIYNPLILAILFFARGGKPLHPGWYVGVDLIVWGLCVPAMVFAVAGGLFWNWAEPVRDTNGNIDCQFFFINQWTKACDPVAFTIGNLEIAGIAFLFLVTISHFVLFVLACIDTHKWRRMNGTGKTNFELQYNRTPSPEFGTSDMKNLVVDVEAAPHYT